jgi:pimeloyl-ACP methyl ester carboxylesterase
MSSLLRLFAPSLALIIALIPSARAQSPDSTAADSSVAVPRGPTIPITPFFIEGIEDTFLTATLEVPENRDAPEGRKIALHIVIVPAVEKKTGRPPLFDIAGGPGIAATEGAAAYAGELRIHREQRDVVLVDQRGTGRSNPLHCPELEKASTLSDNDDLDAVRRCRDELAKGADLAHYSTLDAVHDIDDVRIALGYDKIDLAGLSYGTQVVQVYMREYPDHVHAALMMGTVPLGEQVPLHHARNAEEVLQKLLDDCDADPDCGRAFPSLRREWGELLEAFDVRSFVNAQYLDSTGSRNVRLPRGPFFETLRMLLLTTTMQRRVPLLIHEAATGNFQPFLEVALAGGEGTIAEGMYLSVACPEGTVRIAPAEIEAATTGTFCGRYRADRQVAMCREWGLAAAPEADLRPVTSAIPTLLLAGAMDYVTPIAWAQAVSSRLTNSLVLVIDHMGHYPGGLENMPCYDAVIDQFFRTGSVVGLDATCFATMRPPDFVTE